MKFIDKNMIRIRAGKGGDGLMSFRSGPNQPKMGADGGDGGKGGDVYVTATESLNTLAHLNYNELLFAEDGQKGGPNERTGACGEDLILKLPPGTRVLTSTGKQYDLTEVGRKYLIAKGGQRGLGNHRFVKPTQQAPEFAIEGKEGEELTLSLELMLIADVGLAGFPNAGKSTLLSSLSAARPKVANYPFTTLTPQLGVVSCDMTADEWPTFVMADIPGLIEGAAEGRGLGHDFLKHLERSKFILFMLNPLDDEARSLKDQFENLRSEMQAFNKTLYEKPFLVAINKMDAIEVENEFFQDQLKSLQQLNEINQTDLFLVSAASRHGLDELIRSLRLKLMSLSQVEPESDNLAHSRPKLEDYTLINSPFSES